MASDQPATAACAFHYGMPVPTCPSCIAAQGKAQPTTAAIVARQDCPYCGAPPGERCGTGCRHQYRQEAGQVKNDGADYLRAFWAAQGAPTDG